MVEEEKGSNMRRGWCYTNPMTENPHLLSAVGIMQGAIP
jgi:hypothetical protein